MVTEPGAKLVLPKDELDRSIIDNRNAKMNTVR